MLEFMMEESLRYYIFTRTTIQHFRKSIGFIGLATECRTTVEWLGPTAANTTRPYFSPSFHDEGRRAFHTRRS